MKTKKEVLIKHYRVLALRFGRELREKSYSLDSTLGLMQELGLKLVNDYGMDWDELEAIEVDAWKKHDELPAWGY